MRKIIFSLLIFLLLPSLASAFYEDFDDSVPDILTRWNALSSSGSYRNSSVLISTDYAISPTYTNYGNQVRIRSPDSTTSYLVSNNPINIQYFSFMVCGGAGSRSLYLRNSPTGAQSGAAVAQLSGISTSNKPSKIEVVSTNSYIYMYQNGVEIASVVNPTGSATSLLYPCVAGYNNEYISIDDVADGSFIDVTNVIYESTDNINVKWSAQLLRSHQNSEYNITLYSITNPNNAGELTSWNLNDMYSSSGLEFGYFSFSRAEALDLNYGLYLLEMTMDGGVLYDTYFYYDNLASPSGFPELLFLAESDVKAEIRDDSNNGGQILGGGSVYLYPAILEGGIYNISYDILETPYSIQAEITKIYNTTDLNGTNLLFSGLSSQNYYASVDGTAINGTNGADTWNYTVNWETLDSHIISFAPDYTLPGVYGYIKNSETQNPIKSATVAISNGTFTEYLFTDDNGMYYFTRGMVPGSYNVTASKSGYTTSVPYSVTTQEGSTTRQDIFLDPVSGSGVYYAPHDVTFTVLEYWYSSAGLPGVSYAVYDDENESVKNGTTGSKGTFTVTEMDAGKNYSFILTYNGTTYTEYLEPGLTEYTLVLNKEGIVHQYYNSWLNLTYAENSNNATVLYTSSKTVSEASFTVTASNGTQVQADTLNTTSGTFTFNFSEGDYILQFNIEASDGSTASQAWSISSPPEVNLFPDSYPTWLKNTLFVAIIIIFLLAFGKSKNDIACGSVAVLTSFGYYFEWLSCSFNFVVLVWIIAIGAIFLHYKRTGAVG